MTYLGKPAFYEKPIDGNINVTRFYICIFIFLYMYNKVYDEMCVKDSLFFL